MKRFFAILLVAVLLLSMIPATSMAAKYGTVVGGWLRLRSAPNFNASTITSYYTGTVVEITDTVDGWYRVHTPDGRKGYMYGQYLQVGSSSSSSSSSADAYVTSHNGYGVRLRKGPGTGYRVLGTYDVGTPVTLLERGNYWCKISIRGTTGYMMTQFLSIGGGYYDDDDDDKVECYATIWSRNGYGVRLRKGPGKDYGTIGTYSVGTTVAVLDKGSTWDKIRVGSRVGYMMNEFLDYHKTNEVTSVTLNTYEPSVGTVLSVKAISPSKATVSYEWRVDGTTKGTASTYTVTSGDVGSKIQLKVTGTGKYTGSAKSEQTDKVLPNTQITDMTLNSSVPVVGDTLSVKSITPSAAANSVNYAWIIKGTQVSNAATYTVKDTDLNETITLIVTGKGEYSGSITRTTQKVTASGTLSGVSIANTTNTAAGAVPAVDDVLKAIPAPAQATIEYYQWYRGTTKITNATSETYKLTSADVGEIIKVEIKAKAPYVGGPLTAQLTATVVAKTVAPVIDVSAFTNNVVPNAKMGEAYSLTLTASGTPPIQWSAAGLPAGLNIDPATGIIAGTPTETATAKEFTVTATNAAKQADTKTLKITVEAGAEAKLTIASSIVTVQEGYTADDVVRSINIQNVGTADATITSVERSDESCILQVGNWTIVAGATADQSWKITFPTGKSAGTEMPVTVRVNYNDGEVAEGTVTLKVSGSGTDDDEPTAGVAPVIETYGEYTEEEGDDTFAILLLTSAGSGTLTWAAPEKPDWLDWDIEGENKRLKGTLPAYVEGGENIYTFTLIVESNDATLSEEDRRDSKEITITVTKKETTSTDPSTPETNEVKPTITSTSLADGKVGEMYSVQLVADVTENVTWTISNLPNGLIANEDGTIRGIPEAFGTFTVTATVKNNANQDESKKTSDEATFTLRIEDVDKYILTVINGTGGGEYEEGKEVEIKANDPEEGKKFKEWVCAAMDLTDEGEVATITMPAANITIKAVYEEEEEEEVKPQQLEKTSSITWAADGMSVSWKEVANASGYRIQRTGYDEATHTSTTYFFKNPCKDGDIFYVTALGDGECWLDGERAESQPFESN